MNSKWSKVCKERESRELCHVAFWCGEDRAHALNLSPGGMCFRIDRRAEPGETVLLHQGPGLKVRARIAWTRRLDRCTEIGVQFLSFNQESEKWVESIRQQAEVHVEKEPILALPAPGQTYRPSLSQSFKPLQNSNSASTTHRIGKSWSAARQIMGN